jgi:colanic acid biosynthesis glycosyl transferase WcaI
MVIPPWSHDQYVRFDPAGREEFRARYGLTHKFVVMHSGNHSPCHPLETLLQAAERLAGRDEIIFCLVGGGSEFREIRDGLHLRGLRSIRCIPYQPIEKLSALSASLSAADLHVMLMGDPFVGIVHPCKINKVLAVTRPFLYVGPRESHIGNIIAQVPRLGMRMGMETWIKSRPAYPLLARSAVTARLQASRNSFLTTSLYLRSCAPLRN